MELVNTIVLLSPFLILFFFSSGLVVFFLILSNTKERDSFGSGQEKSPFPHTHTNKLTRSGRLLPFRLLYCTFGPPSLFFSPISLLVLSLLIFFFLSVPLCEVHSFCFVFRFVRIYIRGASFCCCCLLVCFSRYSILQTSLFTPSLLPLPFPVAERVKGKKRKKRSQAQALFNEKKNCFCSSLATHKILFLLVAFPLV